MPYYTYEIVIEKEAEDGGYSAYSPSLPGCFSNGRTVEEARQNLRDALEQHIRSLLAHGQTIPRSEKRVHVEELTVGVP
jgi:predicted RNase H-like HicB family nuclease